MLMVRAGACRSVGWMRVKGWLLVGKKLVYEIGQEVRVQSLAVPVVPAVTGPEVDHQPPERRAWRSAFISALDRLHARKPCRAILIAIEGGLYCGINNSILEAAVLNLFSEDEGIHEEIHLPAPLFVGHIGWATQYAACVYPVHV